MPEDHDDELKGVALRCLWPNDLSTSDLLSALTPRRRPTLYGAYESFLLELDREGFAATGHLATGLRWAKDQASDSPDTNVMHRIAMRIAQAALHHPDDPEISRELTALLMEWARHYTSPLACLPSDSLDLLSPAERHDRAPLHTNPEARRRVIDLLAPVMRTRHDMLTIDHCTPGLRNKDDFRWLLGRACDEQYTLLARQNYLHLAWLLPWEDSSENVDAWLRVCDDEPVKSILGNQRSVELASDGASELRSRWKRSIAPSPPEEIRPLDPPPSQRVAEVLRLAETRDARYFCRLCAELTLEPTSTRYRCERFLTRTSGWREADSGIRARIVGAAKAYLSSPNVVSETATALLPKSLHVDVMGAMWLLLERDSPWLESRSDSWWGDWCWYVLRQLVPDLHGEPSEPKRDTLRLLSKNSPRTMKREILALASDRNDGFEELLPSLLRLLTDIPNPELDEGMCAALRGSKLAEPSATAVAEFVLTRAPSQSIPVCLDILTAAPAGTTTDAVARTCCSFVVAQAAGGDMGIR